MKEKVNLAKMKADFKAWFCKAILEQQTDKITDEEQSVFENVFGQLEDMKDAIHQGKEIIFENKDESETSLTDLYSEEENDEEDLEISEK